MGFINVARFVQQSNRPIGLVHFEAASLKLSANVPTMVCLVDPDPQVEFRRLRRRLNELMG